MGCKRPKIGIFWCKTGFSGFQNAFFGFPDPKNGGCGHIFGLWNTFSHPAHKENRKNVFFAFFENFLCFSLKIWRFRKGVRGSKNLKRRFKVRDHFQRVAAPHLPGNWGRYGGLKRWLLRATYFNAKTYIRTYVQPNFVLDVQLNPPLHYTTLRFVTFRYGNRHFCSCCYT